MQARICFKWLQQNIFECIPIRLCTAVRANKQAKLPIRLLCIAASAIASLKRRQQTKNNNNPAARTHSPRLSFCVYIDVYSPLAYIQTKPESKFQYYCHCVCMRSVIAAQKRIAPSPFRSIWPISLNRCIRSRFAFVYFGFSSFCPGRVAAPLGNDMLFSDVKFILVDNNKRPNHVRNNNFFLCSRSLRLCLCAIVLVVCVRGRRA